MKQVNFTNGTKDRTEKRGIHPCDKIGIEKKRKSGGRNGGYLIAKSLREMDRMRFPGSAQPGNFVYIYSVNRVCGGSR